MITETGKVVAVSGDRVWVQTIRISACESCSARSGCGQRALAGVSGGRANQVLVANHLNARVGDEVTVAIEESALLGASLLVYALPLALMVLGAVSGHQLSGGAGYRCDGWCLSSNGCRFLRGQAGQLEAGPELRATAGERQAAVDGFLHVNHCRIENAGFDRTIISNQQLIRGF